jgi:hypothetical protein
LRLAAEFIGEIVDEIHRRIHHAIPPARLDRLRTRVQLARVDDRHAAGFRDVVGTAIPITLRTRDDHRNRVRIVPMRRELVVVIFGREEIRAGQKRRTPVAGGILKTMGGGHGEKSGRTGQCSASRALTTRDVAVAGRVAK